MEEDMVAQIKLDFNSRPVNSGKRIVVHSPRPSFVYLKKITGAGFFIRQILVERFAFI